MPDGLRHNKQAAQRLESLAGQMKVKEDGLLYQSDDPDGEDVPWRLVVAASMRDELCKVYHDREGAHRSSASVLARLRLRYWWPGMTAYVRQYVATCNTCQERSQPRGKRTGLLQPFQLPAGPHRRWAMDICKMARSERGNVDMLLFICLYSRFIVAFALPDHTGNTLVECVLKGIIHAWDTPESLHSDLGPEMVNREVRRVCDMFTIKRTTTTAYHPQGNGITERANRTILDGIAKLCSEDQKDWDLYLDAVVGTYNKTVHTATGYSPFFIMTGGRDPSIGVDVATGPLPEEPLPIKDHLRTAAARMERALPLLRRNVLEAQRRMALYYDKDRKPTTFKVNDLVMLERPSVRARPGQVRKLLRWWKGPYRIVQLSGGKELEVTIVGMNNTSDRQVVTVKRLKRFAHRTEDGPVPTFTEHEIDEIDDECESDDFEGEKEYRVLYKGFTMRHRQWVRASEINAPELLAKWEKRKAAKQAQLAREKAQEPEEEETNEDVAPGAQMSAAAPVAPVVPPLVAPAAVRALGKRAVYLPQRFRNHEG